MNHNTEYNQLKPEDAVGIPLSEIDQSVIEDTYCVISKRWGKTFVHRYTCLPTLYIFHPYSSARRAAIAFTTHICYDLCLTFIIFAALIDLVIPHSLPLLFEHITLIFYISESVHVTISRGFILGSYAYLKNPWMCFDFIITVLSFPDLELNISTVFGIQSLRGIRGLNLISKIPGVQTMAEGILLSIFRMYGVATIIILFLLSISLTAKQLFMGIFHRRCIQFTEDFMDANNSYSDFIYNASNWDTDEHNKYVMCGNSSGAQKCKENYTCLNTFRGIVGPDFTSFDTLNLSLINSLRLLTQDEWEIIYDRVIEATGPSSFFFFLPVIFLGSFFLLSLMLVVVTSTYDSVVNKKEEAHPLRNYKYHSSFCFDINRLTLYPLSTSPKILKKVFKERDEILIHQHWMDETWQKVKNTFTLKLDENDFVNMEENSTSLGNWMAFRRMLKKVSDSKAFHYFILFTIIFNTVLLASEHSNMSKTFTAVLKYCSLAVTGIFTLEIIIKLLANGRNYFFNWWNILDFVIVTESVISIILNFVTEYSVLRSLRLLELVKVQQQWPALHRVISIVLISVRNIFRLLIVMIFIIFTFAVIGNKCLSEHLKSDVEIPRWSFSTLWGSLFSVFQIFAGEWYKPLDDCLSVCRLPILCIAIIIPFYVIGHLVILNVFTAVLLSAFDASALHLPKLKKKKKVILKKNNVAVNEYEENPSKFKQVLLYFKKFIQTSSFENIISILVVGSCITMAFEDVYLETKPKEKYIIEVLNLIFTLLFISEFILKWFAIGIKKYLNDPWMRFDFILVVLSLIELFIKYTFTLSERSTHFLISLRVLRPLRLIPRWKTLQLVVDSLVLSLPAIFHVVLVVLFIWLPFAILGVHFFAGKFFRCVDEFQERVTEYIYNKTDCLNKGYAWEDMFYNFNNIGNSYLSLFQLAVFSGWTDLVEIMVDFNENDFQPVTDNRSEYYAFVVVFVFLGAFLSLNMFVAVAVDTFKNSEKYVKMRTAEILLTDRQKRYYSALLRLGKRKPVMHTVRPSNKILNICYTITYSLWFRVLIFIFICANTVTVSLNSYNDSSNKKIILHHCDHFFTAFYVLEFIIKILGLRKFYFYDFWNIFDFILLCIHIISDLLTLIVEESEVLSFVYAFRLLRVLRLLRLTEMLIDLRRVLHCIVASVPSLINISIFLFIVIFIYSILGMSLFGHQNFHGSINSKVNFRTFIQSFLLLFRLTTAQGWEETLESLSIQPPFCDEEEKNCGNFVISVIFILSFIIISNIILVNIFIAVILENYIEAILQENDIINDDNLTNFYRVWKCFDPKATQFILYEQLSDFLDHLNEDMRISKPNHVAIAYMNLPLIEGRKVHCLNVLKGILEIKVGDVEDSATFRIICDQVQKKYIKMFPKLKELWFVETTMQLKRRDLAARIIQSRLRKMRAQKALKV